MPKLVQNAALFFLALSAGCTLLFSLAGWSPLLPLAITFGTAAYHLGARRWYQPRPWEDKLYRLLRVKSWKDRMPTFYPDEFSPEKHSWEEIAQVMCQSELVHETNILMSFLPLLAAIPFGAFWVFLVTSLAGAIFDLSLAILQRYNRPRVVRLARRRAAQR